MLFREFSRFSLMCPADVNSILFLIWNRQIRKHDRNPQNHGISRKNLPLYP